MHCILLEYVQGLVEAAAKRDDYEAALVAIAVWLRFSAARHLTWNRNYNVKPREIAAAQVLNGLHFPVCGQAVTCALSLRACKGVMEVAHCTVNDAASWK